MDYLRIILDGFMMSAWFNLATALWWLLDPVAFVDGYPKAIKQAVPQTKGNKNAKGIFCLLVIVPVLLFGISSAWDAGINGFWSLFWTAYLEWIFVDLGDLIGLDLIFREKMGKRLELPGTEGNPAYKRTIWMKTLGLPEHLLEWPLLICPFFALVSAGIGTPITTLI